MAADLGFAGGGKTAHVRVGLEGSVKAARASPARASPARGRLRAAKP